MFNATTITIGDEGNISSISVMVETILKLKEIKIHNINKQHEYACL